jgi:hypothetical protein
MECAAENGSLTRLFSELRMRSPVSQRALGECNAIRSWEFVRSRLTFDWRLEYRGRRLPTGLTTYDHSNGSRVLAISSRLSLQAPSTRFPGPQSCILGSRKVGWDSLKGSLAGAATAHLDFTKPVWQAVGDFFQQLF